MLLTIIFLPLFGAIISGFLGFIIGKRGSKLITICFTLISMLFSFKLFYDVTINKNNHYIEVMSWIDSELFVVVWSFLFDSLTVTMLLVVTTISTFVHIYSASYMAVDPHVPRFMSYLSFFTFFMLVLVTADNLLVLFVGWEGVGLCSYLLISFWFTRVQANKSSIKAIIMNRIGDIGLTIGIVLIFFAFKTLDFHIIFALVPFFYSKNILFLGLKVNFLFVTCLSLFIGVMGKSAQLGLHTWLPDAMEGPTPVSALIHAATMVTAGVFLLIRCSPIFEFSPSALLVIAFFGSLTTFFAATAGMLQHDIKKVIAYSTCSQLGYMVFICGLSAYNLSLFHLYTHAFFKALLFLSAGAIIHGLSNEQDIRKMGGLLQLMPLSYTMLLIGSLALIGFPFLSGFYSKDAILETAYACIQIKGTFTFWLGTISAICTVFYSVRLIFLVFITKTNSFKHYINNVHEMDILTAIPLTLLSFGSIFLGFLSKDFFIGMGSNVFKSAIFVLPNNISFIDAEFIPFYIKVIPTLVSVVGTIVFLLVYNNMLLKLVNFKQNNFKLYIFLIKKWYIDSIYNNVFSIKLLYTGYYFTLKLLDKGLIEKFGPKGVISTFYFLSKKVISLQTGYIFNYSCAIILMYIWIINIVYFIV